MSLYPLERALLRLPVHQPEALRLRLELEPRPLDLLGKRLRVRRTSASHLRRVGFTMDGLDYDAIEQNPEKPSRWAN